MDHYQLKNLNSNEGISRHTHDALWEWDVQAGTVWWNEGFRDLFGYQNVNQFLTYDTWYDCVHPDDRERVTAGINNCLREKHLFWQEEYRFKKADEVFVSVLERASVQIKNGEVIRMIGSIVPLTEWNERVEHEERIRLALDSAQLGTWDLNLSTRVVTLDKRCQELHALGAATALSYDSMIQHIYSFDRSRIESAVRDSLNKNSGGDYDQEYRIEHGDGSLRWVRSKGRAYFDSEGSAYRFAGTSLDITAEKRKDQVIRDVETRFQTAFDNASLGIAMSDQDGRIFLVNKAFAELVGYSQEELYLDNWQKITHPEDLALNTEMIRRLWTGEDSTMNLDKRYIKKDGSTVWANLNSTIIPNAKGEPDTMFSIVRDIGEERKAQVQQEKLLSLVSNSVELMAVLETNGTSSYINKAGYELLGFTSQQEASETHISSLLSAEDFEKLKKEVIPAIDGKGKWSGNMMVRNAASGEMFPVQNSSMRIDDPYTNEAVAVGLVMRDLRSEYEATLQLRASEERFRAVVEQSPVAIGILKGPDLIVEAANDPLLHLWRKKADILHKPIIEALPEIKDQPFPKLLRDVYTTGKTFKGYEVLALLEKDGVLEDAWFNFVYSAMYDREKIVGVMVIASEVTEQVKAKKDLEKSENRFRNLVDDAPIPIGVYVGREMRITLANQKILDTWGKGATVIGKTFYEALPELKNQGFFELLDGVFTSGKTYQATEDKVDLVMNGKLQTFYFNFTYKALHDSEGNIYGVINTATDVTALVHAREGLKEAQEKLRIAIETAKLGTWTIDPINRVAFFADRLRDLFGFEENEVEMMLGLQCIHEKDRDRVTAKLLEALQPGSDGAYEDEYTIVNIRNQQEYIIRSVGKVFFENDRAEYIIGTVQDITNQRLTEQQLESVVAVRTEELKNANLFLQRSNEELEQFAYVASHDLQEPLRKIRMFSGMLKEISSVEKDRQAVNYLDKVISSAERMSNLIQDLLNFSRINREPDGHELIDLNIILKQVKEDFELLIRQKGASLTIGHLSQIQAIPLQMNQLFYNLIGNALKFTDEKRKPEIKVSSVLADENALKHLQDRKHKAYCLLTVEDNGIGFEDELAEKIFTIFQRLHVRSEFEGTGIGLALCKKIVIQLGGAIWAHGEPGKGSTFYIVLPCIPPSSGSSH